MFVSFSSLSCPVFFLFFLLSLSLLPSFFLWKDIGRTTSGPQISKATGGVSITYYSSTRCAADPAQNYTSTIVFACQRGLELVSHVLYGCFSFTTLSFSYKALNCVSLFRVLHKCWGCRDASTCLSGRRLSSVQIPPSPAAASSMTLSCTSPLTCRPSLVKFRWVLPSEVYFPVVCFLFYWSCNIVVYLRRFT